MDLGFAPSDWPRLAGALRRHGSENPVVDAVETPFGTRYVVEGILHAPDGRTPAARTVWFIGREDAETRLVTAYPVRRRWNR